MIQHKYDMGDKLKDIVTGTEGIVMGITKYSTGCIHYGILADKLVSGKLPDWEWLDETRMKLTKKRAVKFDSACKLKESVGGPQPNPPVA